MNKDIFEKIDKKEMEGFSKRLIEEKEEGRRFAAIQIRGDRLAEKDITFHKTAFEACKYILMAPTDNGLYIFRSMSLLEDDVKRILEAKQVEKDQSLAAKRSKGLDLER